MATGPITVVCAGDSFISPELLRDAVAARVSGVTFRLHKSNWPDEPMHHTHGVKEWCGDPEEIAALADGADAIITHCAPINAELLAGNPGLQFIGCCRGGAVNVDLEAAAAQGVTVANTPGRNAVATAEFSVSLLLAVMRRVVEGSKTISEGGWGGYLYRYDRAGVSLDGKTVGMVGLGQVGQRVARILSGFGARIIYFDPWVNTDALPPEVEMTSVSWEELLAQADVVSVHARLTPETRHMIDAAALAKMKSSAFVLNTARGELVDYSALAQALREGRIAGAGLDVFPTEPIPADAEILGCPNVVLTPHMAGATQDTAVFAANLVADEFVKFLGTRE